LTLRVDGSRVATDANTTFAGGNCQDVRNGTKLVVSGTVSGELVRASRVELTAK
jgi:hypothetical protein